MVFSFVVPGRQGVYVIMPQKTSLRIAVKLSFSLWEDEGQQRQTVVRDLIVLVMPRSGEGPVWSRLAARPDAGYTRLFQGWTGAASAQGSPPRAWPLGTWGWCKTGQSAPLSVSRGLPICRWEKENKWLYIEGLFSVLVST